MNQLVFSEEQFRDAAGSNGGGDGKDHQGLPFQLAADNGLGDTAASLRINKGCKILTALVTV